MSEENRNSRRLRSLLFIPADSERKLSKARSSDADVIIFDLEDSVAMDAKPEARKLLTTHLDKDIGYRFAVRINGSDGPDYFDDLATVVAFAPEFVMLPKCNGQNDIRMLDHALSALERVHNVTAGSIGILPLVTESAQAALTMDYRDAGPRLVALAFAGEDLSADLGVKARSEDRSFNPLLADAQRHVAMAAAAAGVPAIDTPFPDHRDSEGLASEARLAVLLGFAGKLCIHPGQTDTVNGIFKPTPEQVSWALAVEEALGNNATGVAVVDGKMVDKAHLKLALRILANRG